MSLHARAIALSAGANDSEIERLAAALIECGEIKLERATALLEELRTASRR
jgi:hydroxymethylglutaryl-CoA reductase